MADVRLDGLSNFRDTGGMLLATGGTTRSGVLYRSDALISITTDGLTQLAASGIGTIVDFRTPSERAAAPDRLPQTRQFEQVELSILQGAMADMLQLSAPSAATPTADAADRGEVAEREALALSALPTLGEMYVGMLQGGADAFASVARLVAGPNDESHPAVLIHCTAGKDRTGVAAALLLCAAGAARDDVVADYASSQQHLSGAWADGMLHSISQIGIPVTPALRELATETPPAAIEQALDWVEQHHGGAAGYLAAGGLTPTELAALRRRLAA